ncbi:MAG: hypothetical protein ABEJ58_05670 [Halodesulfurarchaeum sp.]
MPDPPDTDEPSRTDRRGFLATTASGVSIALSGCAGSIGTTGPRSVHPPAVVEATPTSRVWNFPRGSSDENTPIQIALEQAARAPRAEKSTPIRFRVSATVFGHTNYHHRRISIRLRSPARSHADRTPAKLYVSPPATFDSVRVTRTGGEISVVLTDLETVGTIEVDVLVAPGTEPLPETLGYEFSVTAAQTGLIGRNIRASTAGSFPIARERA